MTELSVELSEEDFLCVGHMLKTYERNHGKQERVELAKYIVERAKDPENYLHKYFDWADKKQRRVLANSIVLKLRAKTVKRPAKPVLVEKTEGPPPVYTMPMPDFAGVPDRADITAAVLEAGRLVRENPDWESRARLSPAARKAVSSVLQANKGLISSVVRKYVKRLKTLEEEDLVQAGNIGLMRAIPKYDPSLGGWSTYAFSWVFQAVTRIICEEDSTIRAPVHVRDLHHRVERVRGELESKNQRPVTDEEVAASIKSDISRVRLAVSKSLGVPVSLDAPSSRGEGGRDTTLHDIIPDEHVDEAEESCDQTRRETAVRKLLCLLSPRERRILKGRFWDESTLTSLGLPEGITRERARQIQKEAIEKLRKVAEELGVAKELGISL